MVPHGEPTRATIAGLLEVLGAGDLIVDGGNSRYTDSIAHAALCRQHGVELLDVGVSGGVWGLEEGYCLMAGGTAAAFQRVEPVLVALAPEGGVARVGESGAGHFVKMIHNAIEYAMLQAIGEGFEAMARADFALDLGQIADLWNHGSVVRCWLLELLARAFAEEGPTLDAIAPYVEESGTGRWTVEYALGKGIPVPAIAQALFDRFDSQLAERFSYKVIAALRQQFGGHAVRADGIISPGRPESPGGRPSDRRTE
jgi:6-phosphogluconate dehydrogenase